MSSDNNIVRAKATWIRIHVANTVLMPTLHMCCIKSLAHTIDMRNKREEETVKNSDSDNNSEHAYTTTILWNGIEWSEENRNERHKDRERNRDSEDTSSVVRRYSWLYTASHHSYLYIFILFSYRNSRLLLFFDFASFLFVASRPFLLPFSFFLLQLTAAALCVCSLFMCVCPLLAHSILNMYFIVWCVCGVSIWLFVHVNTFHGPWSAQTRTLMYAYISFHKIECISRK